jgi:hypothetical protein
MGVESNVSGRLHWAIGLHHFGIAPASVIGKLYVDLATF